MKKKVTPAQMKDALAVAHGMLAIIELGGSLTFDAWRQRMGKVESALNLDTIRASEYDKGEYSI